MPVEEGVERIWFWFNLPCKISGMDWDRSIQEGMEEAAGIYDELKSMGWDWQSMDSVPKAPLGGKRPEQTQRIEAS